MALRKGQRVELAADPEASLPDETGVIVGFGPDIVIVQLTGDREPEDDTDTGIREVPVNEVFPVD